MAILNKRGITPVIAVILILMMTIAVAGAMYFFTAQIQTQQQGGVESFQSKFFTVTSTQANVARSNYNDSAQSLDIFVQNIGNNPIPTDNSSNYPTTEWIVFDSNQRSLCSTNWGGAATSGNVSCTRGCASDIPVGQIRRVTLVLGANSPCSLVTVANGTRISFTIDFAGKTTVGGSFDK